MALSGHLSRKSKTGQERKPNRPGSSDDHVQDEATLTRAAYLIVAALELPNGYLRVEDRADIAATEWMVKTGLVDAVRSLIRPEQMVIRNVTAKGRSFPATFSSNVAALRPHSTPRNGDAGSDS